MMSMGVDMVAGVSAGVMGKRGFIPCTAAAGTGPELARGGTFASNLGEL
jgi:hypothetical protein